MMTHHASRDQSGQRGMAANAWNFCSQASVFTFLIDNEAARLVNHVCSSEGLAGCFLQVFRPDELQNLLKKIRESSLALLDAGLDPLGYELSW